MGRNFHFHKIRWNGFAFHPNPSGSIHHDNYLFARFLPRATFARYEQLHESGPSTTKDAL